MRLHVGQHDPKSRSDSQPLDLPNCLLAIHGNYGHQQTFHNLPLLVSSFGEDVVKRWSETSPTLPAFGQSLWKLWCSGWERKPTPSHTPFESAARRNRPTQRPGWTHTLMCGHWAPMEQLHPALSSWWGDPSNMDLPCLAPNAQRWPGTAGRVKDTAPACPLNFLAFQGLASRPSRYPNAGFLLVDFTSSPGNRLPRKLNKEPQCPCQLALL